MSKCSIKGVRKQALEQAVAMAVDEDAPFVAYWCESPEQPDTIQVRFHLGPTPRTSAVVYAVEWVDSILRCLEFALEISWKLDPVIRSHTGSAGYTEIFCEVVMPVYATEAVNRFAKKIQP